MTTTRRRWLSAACVLLTWAAAGCSGSCGSDGDYASGGEAQATVVYVVRHAEKEEGEDPDLSPRGELRALALPGELELPSLRAIYSTATKRTQETAAPVAALTGIEVTRMPPDDYEGLLQRVRSHAGKAVLVVAHSNTIPPMLAALGVREHVTLADDDYGDLFVVTVPAQGPATLELRRFGDEPVRPPRPL